MPQAHYRLVLASRSTSRSSSAVPSPSGEPVVRSANKPPSNPLAQYRFSISGWPTSRRVRVCSHHPLGGWAAIIGLAIGLVYRASFYLSASDWTHLSEALWFF